MADLTTVAAVREFLQKQTGDVAQDAVIQTLITSASAAIQRYTARQFFPEDGVAKVFEWNQTMRPGWVSLEPFEVRSVTSVELDTDTADPDVLDADQYRMWPKPAPDGTYLAIRLNPFSVGSAATFWYPRREVTITGDWGMNAIPADVAHWATVTVAIWLRREVSAFEQGMNLDAEYLERPRSLPSSVASGLDLYSRTAMS